VDHPTAPASGRGLRSRRPLDTGWRLRLATPSPDAPTSLIGASIPATVPGNVYLDLLEADLIPDPYLGTNELDLRWIGCCDWTYDCTFEWAPDQAERLDLVFEGLDTLASVWLDGWHLGDAASMHRTWCWEVTHLLNPGAHTLEVRFEAPVAAAQRLEAGLGRYPHANAYPEPFNMLRTMACNFGWDWGPQLPSAGIWRPAWIGSSSVARLASVRPVATITGATGRVDARVELERIGDTARPLRVTARVADRVAETTTGPGMGEVLLQLDVPATEPWWPHSRGAQPRYPLRVELWDDATLLDSWEQLVGFRTVELDTREDDIGSRFQLVINGSPIWVRGANWIPDDCFPARVTRERYRERLLQAKAANIDLLRVWGGGVFESDDFYDLCDELGIMVWQDFPFACATYPVTPAMTAHVLAEARDNVTRLMAHPSLVIWNGNNECVWLAELLDWPSQMDGRPWGRSWWESDLPQLVGATDPARPYWPGSPTSPSDSGAPPNDPNHGTMHIWDVWNRLDYEAYREHRPRFASEFGYQAPATFSTMSRAVGAEDLSVDSPVLAHHQKATDGMGKLARGLVAHFPAPTDFGDWLYRTQLNQARAITLGVEHLRSIRDICSGTIVWQLNDCWPVISWSAIDGDGRRKPVWYALRRAYADRLLTIQPAEFRLRAVFVNETATTWSAPVHARRMRLDGELLADWRVSVDIDAGGFLTMDMPGSVGVPEHATEEILVLDTDAQRSIWTWLPDRDLAYPAAHWDATATAEATGYAVSLTAHTLLRDVCLFPDRLHPDAAVDDMLVTLLPGETATFRVSGAVLADPDALLRAPVLRCVNDTSHG
jgi:beta-mannosidase